MGWVGWWGGWANIATHIGYLVLEEVCKLGSVEDPLGDPESIDDIIEKSKKKQKNPTTPALT